LRENRQGQQSHHGRSRFIKTAVLRGQLLHDALYTAAEKAVGKGLPEHIRDDLKSDLIEAVLLKEFPLQDMPLYVAEFMTAHNRGVGSCGARSLDEKIFEDGDTTFVDRLTTDDASSYAD